VAVEPLVHMLQAQDQVVLLLAIEQEFLEVQVEVVV
jgi:hypothetical protein